MIKPSILQPGCADSKAWWLLNPCSDCPTLLLIAASTAFPRSTQFIFCHPPTPRLQLCVLKLHFLVAILLIFSQFSCVCMCVCRLTFVHEHDSLRFVSHHPFAWELHLEAGSWSSPELTDRLVLLASLLWRATVLKKELEVDCHIHIAFMCVSGHPDSSAHTQVCPSPGPLSCLLTPVVRLYLQMMLGILSQYVVNDIVGLLLN